MYSTSQRLLVVVDQLLCSPVLSVNPNIILRVFFEVKIQYITNTLVTFQCIPNSLEFKENLAGYTAVVSRFEAQAALNIWNIQTPGWILKRWTTLQGVTFQWPNTFFNYRNNLMTAVILHKKSFYKTIPTNSWGVKKVTPRWGGGGRRSALDATQCERSEAPPPCTQCVQTGWHGAELNRIVFNVRITC